MNILYIGSSGALSLLPFKKLLAEGYTISAVGVFNPIVLHEKVIALENESLSLAANQHSIPLIDLSKTINNILQQCKDHSIELIIMSCYSKRLPDELINFSKYGCFNMHPSLLPRYRGSEPLFWQMKDAAQLGVSWHRVESDFDSGEVVFQRKIFADEGASYVEINQQLALMGSQLLLNLLTDLSAEKLTGQKQDDLSVSYFPYPSAKDFTVDTRGAAQLAYNYMRATYVFGYTYQCRVGDRIFTLTQALDYDNNASLEEVEIHRDTLYIPFKEGVLIASYTDKITTDLI